MNFDASNPIVVLCARGMEMEGAGKPEEALSTFQKAWEQAERPWEKSIAAHYVARHQNNLAESLRWNKTALDFGLEAQPDEMSALLPSLYLNIGKNFEDMNDINNALENYLLADSISYNLPEDGYGRMIRAGITTALARIKHTGNSNKLY